MVFHITRERVSLMQYIKRAVAVLVTLALLAAVPVASASASTDLSVLLSDDVQHSITTEEATGDGLAFRFTLNVRGAAVNKQYEFVNKNATAVVNGVSYKVVSMGAVVTNDPVAAKDAAQMVRENAGVNRKVVDVAGKRLCDVTDTTCSFAVRVINLPDKGKNTAIACRPYCVVQAADGTQQTVYGDIHVSTYRLQWHKVEGNGVVLPAIGFDVDVVKQKDRIRVSAATAEYGLDTQFAETLTVSLTLTNYTKNWITEEIDWIEYTCYDKNGAVVQEATQLHIGCIDTKKHPSRTFQFTIPAETAEVRVTNCRIAYWTEWV